MITVGMQVHDEILVEEMVEFPLERNSDEATPLHDHPVEYRFPVHPAGIAFPGSTIEARSQRAGRWV